MDGWKNNLQKSGGNFFFSAIEKQLYITQKMKFFLIMEVVFTWWNFEKCFDIDVFKSKISESLK